MKTNVIRSSLLIMLFLASGYAHAGWTGIGVIEPKSVAVQPGSKVNVGTKTKIVCSWKQVSSMQINTDWANAKKLAALNWQLPGEITMDGVKIKTFTISVKSSGGQGTASVEWDAVKPGTHNGTCSVDPSNITNVAGNKTVNFTINVMQMAPGASFGGNVSSTPSALPIGGAIKKPGNNGPVMPVSPKGLPDITSAAHLVIGQTPTSWGTTVNVDAKQAFLMKNGVCQFVVQNTARNIGLAPTGPFDSLWKNGQVSGSWSRSWGSLAPGAQDTQKDLLLLKPGMNDLHLTLDNLGKVQESNEGNNQFRVRVNLSGSCGAAPGIVPPPGSGQNGTSASPRLPQPQRTLQR